MSRIEQSDETPADSGRKRRAKRADVVVAHAALKVTQPANDLIGPWQQRAAWLAALAERKRTHGHPDPKIGAEARALLTAVEHGRRDLQRSMATLPGDVASSTRFEDTVKALDSITGSLERTIELSSPRPERS
jgi:hypothetical protein